LSEKKESQVLQTPQVTTVSNDQALKAAAEQLSKFRQTFKKLAKN
jgi:hypothetical protein